MCRAPPRAPPQSNPPTPSFIIRFFKAIFATLSAYLSPSLCTVPAVRQLPALLNTSFDETTQASSKGGVFILG